MIILRMNPSISKLEFLRVSMKQNGIDAYIIPLSDPHIGEYIPDHWNIITWLTGFTGSAATVVITDSFTGLWTDSRYFIQAEKELAGSGFIIMKPEGSLNSGYCDWLAENIDNDSKIALDGNIFPVDQMRKMQDRLRGRKISFDFDCDLVSDIWSDRPASSESRVWDHLSVFAGKDRSKKIAEVREQMKRQGIDYQLLTSPDDIMWLLNIRGNDLPYTPLIYSFAIIGKEQILLFVDEKRFPDQLALEFDKLGIVMLPYEETAGMISSLTDGSTILLSPSKTSITLFNSVHGRFRIIEDISIPSRLKAIKNKTEIENIGMVMVKDGVALTKFFYWIESDLGIVPMTERSLVMRLHEFKIQQKDFLGPSFATIVAFGEHAALPHYSPTSDSDAELGENGILLVDSGGQYPGGTTDITRTISLGIPTPGQKKDFTMVLKGLIRLATTKFPYGTKGHQIDILAREVLWQAGLNYGHGTGHGVGYCLNVHEGPQNISPSINKTIIEAGMLISDEPAVYREGNYGIRTENLLICYEDEETEFGKFLKFDTVSLCYIDKMLIDKILLNQKEMDWLNSYHSEVYDKLSPHLTSDEKAWLKERTSTI
jgi:Xaa-Pro aminopeptidase